MGGHDWESEESSLFIPFALYSIFFSSLVLIGLLGEFWLVKSIVIEVYLFFYDGIDHKDCQD